MVLGKGEILSRIEEGDITISPFSEDQLTPNGYDLSLSDKVYRMNDIHRPVNPINKNTLSDFVAEEESIDGELKLEPLEPVSVMSREKIGLSSSLLGRIEGRSSLGQLAVFPHFDSGVVDAGFGYEDPQRIVFTLLSCNPNPVILHTNQPVAQLVFEEVSGKPQSKTEYSTYETSPVPGFKNLITKLVDKPFVIGVTGLPASGKSEVAAILSRLLDCPTYSMGDVVKEETRERGLKTTSENVRETSIRLREEDGDDIIASLLVDNIEDDGTEPPLIIEGIRSKDEMTVFKNEMDWDFLTLGIHSPPEIRLSRMKNRERSDDEPTPEHLTRRDEKEANFGVTEALSLSDYMISNDGSLEDLERDVEKTLSRILTTR